MSSITKNTELLRSLSDKYGFLDVGIAKVAFLDKEAKKLEQWLSQGKHGNMNYLEEHFDKRLDPSLLVPGAKSVISFSYNYFPENESLSKGSYKISRYAYGRDYHKVVKNKLTKLLKEWTNVIGEINGRCFVDSAPIMERAWAEKAGLGWRGKNTLLINRKKGSYFFLAEIICDVELEYDVAPTVDHCGSCTKCIDACPTDAIAENGYILDSNKCISYLSIEKKDEIPSAYKEKMEGWMYGCDICQEVCPWNRFSLPHKEDDFRPKGPLLDMKASDWEEITEEVFDHLFYGSPVKRAQYGGLTRNINFLKRVDQ